MWIACPGKRMSDGAEKLFVHAAVEGRTDRAVARRIVGHVGGEMSGVYGERGKSYLRDNIRKYDDAARNMGKAARNMAWIVLVDLDMDAGCPAALRDKWLSKPAPNLCFRIAVREVEAWLMADAESLACYLEAPPARVPRNPESSADPKGDMMELARHSLCKKVREDMAPRSGGGRRIGPAYPGRLIEYAETAWRPEVAAQHSDSLRRAIACLRRLVAGRREAAA